MKKLNYIWKYKLENDWQQFDSDECIILELHYAFYENTKKYNLVQLQIGCVDFSNMNF